jgi:hypothetical protein
MSTSASVEYTWKDARTRPGRTAARTPALAKRSSAPGTSTVTIALSPGGRPSPTRKRLVCRPSVAFVIVDFYSVPYRADFYP